MDSRPTAALRGRGSWLTSRTLLGALCDLGYGWLLIAPDGRILDADNVWPAMLGYTHEELRALPHVAELAAPEDRDAITALHASWAQGERVDSHYQCRLVTKAGIPMDVAGVARAIDTPTGPAVFALARDVSDYTYAKQTVRRAVEVFDRMSVGVTAWDAEGVETPGELRLFGFNAAARQAVQASIGKDLAEHRGSTLAQLWPHLADGASARALLACARNGQEVDLGVKPLGGHSEPLLRRSAIPLEGCAAALLSEDVTAEYHAELRHAKTLERLVTVAEEERARVALALHDDAIQQLAAATLLVQAARDRPDGPTPGDLERLETTLRQSMTALRRLVFDLHPSDPESLEDSVAQAATQILGDTRTHVETAVRVEPDLAADVAGTAYRIVVEALTNVRRHADASNVTVMVHHRDGALQGSVVDDGVGVGDIAVARPGHLGLRGMRERAEALGGTLVVRPGCDGGTTVEFRLPVANR